VQSPVQSDRTAEVVRAKSNLIDTEGLEKAVEDPIEECEVVALGRLARLSEPGQVHHDRVVVLSDRRDDVAPQVGGGRPAMQEQNRWAVPEAAVGHRNLGWLLRRLQHTDPDVLVIRPLYKLTASDPSEERPARLLAEALDMIRTRIGCALLIEHHAGHGSGHMVRPVRPTGSSGVAALA